MAIKAVPFSVDLKTRTTCHLPNHDIFLCIFSSFFRRHSTTRARNTEITISKLLE